MPATHSAAVRAADVTRIYPNGGGVRDVSLVVRPGQALGLVGWNGSGKSTLLRCLLGMEQCTGEIELLDRSPAEWRSLSGVAAGVLDGASQHVGLKVGTILEVTARLHGMRLQESHGTYELLGLPTIWGERFGRLSLGWRQRVLIGAALTSRPQVLLLDEPFNGLDVRAVADLVGLLQAWQRDGLALVIASHHLAALEGICQEVLHLDQGRGRLIRLLGTAQSPDRPVLLRGISREDAERVLGRLGAIIDAGPVVGDVIVRGLTPVDINRACSEARIILRELRYLNGELEDRLST